MNAENNWTYTWSDLDQKKAGKDIAYTVEETGKAAGYTSTVTGNAEEGFIITNTITSVKISKVDITDPERTGRCSYPGDRQGWKCSRRVGFHMGSSRSNWPEAWRNLYPSRDCSTRGIYFDQRYHLYPERDDEPLTKILPKQPYQIMEPFW